MPKLTIWNYLYVKTFSSKDSWYLTSLSSIAIESVVEHLTFENKVYISYFPLLIGVVKLLCSEQRNVEESGVCNLPEVSLKRTSPITPFCWLECGLVAWTGAAIVDNEVNMRIENNVEKKHNISWYCEQSCQPWTFTQNFTWEKLTFIFFKTLVILDFQSLTTDSNLNLLGLDGTDTQFGMKCSISWHFLYASKFGIKMH